MRYPALGYFRMSPWQIVKEIILNYLRNATRGAPQNVPPVLAAPAPNGFTCARNSRRDPGRRGGPSVLGRKDGDQALSAPDALATWVAMKSISTGERQS
jgi:hypothetical protein